MPEPRPIAPALFRTTPSGPRLIAGQCAQCERLHFPVTAWCPYCGAGGSREALLGPDATLMLFTTVQNAPPGYRGPLPYGFGVVELAEGLRVITRLSETRPERLAAGIAMRLAIEPLCVDDDGTPVLSYLFAPVPSAA